ncbi:hypothetical protein EUGRSUZ_I01770 [Eucalyptus grandis]|uniref:Uncharacterized protein n=2 Tax=Eucalyptus grandis TaxID=71139 RepID=A0ACC3JGY3_EUCGR|nr:hypothetical protein EUGRSUZ_I01770 [Eucalyptus grandis]
MEHHRAIPQNSLSLSFPRAKETLQVEDSVNSPLFSHCGFLGDGIGFSPSFLGAANWGTSPVMFRPIRATAGITTPVTSTINPATRSPGTLDF